MTATPALVGAGIGLYAGTNVDDFVLLVAFFSDRRLPPRSIVVGQFLGIAALTLASWLAALATFAFPRAWVGLLGLVPLAMGVAKLRALRRSNGALDEGAVAAAAANQLQRWLRSPVLAVTAVTISDGGDNFAAYVPAFTIVDGRGVLVIAATFAALTGIWCAAAYIVARNPITGHAVRRAGHVGLPFVLMAIGVLVLQRAGTLSLLPH